MSTIIDEINKIVIIAPPKNGCSTVRATFGKSIGLINPSNNKPNITIADMNVIDVYLKDVYKKHRKDNKYIKEYKLYFICRNIEERFVSFINNVLYKRIKSPETVILKPSWENYLQEYKNFSSVDLSVETDINSVLEYQKHIKLNEFKNIDFHGFSQLSFMNMFIRDFPIFTHDDFNIISINNLKNILSKYYGLNYKQVNVTYTKKKTEQNTINRISNLLYKSQLTTNEKHKIHELYREDEMFEKYHNNDNIINLKKKYPFLDRYTDETIIILNIGADHGTLNKLSEFNPKTYSELYPDLEQNIEDCDDDKLIIHYVTHGQFEGRRIN